MNKLEGNYLEKLSPQNSTLVMVDYLTGFLPGIRTMDWHRYQENVTAVAKIAQIFKLPTILLGDEGGFRGNFFEVINEVKPQAQLIERHTPSAWRSPAFVAALEKIGRKKIIMGGISIDNCVTQTGLDVLAAGYELYVLADVSGTTSSVVELAAMMRLTQAGAVMTSWVSLASELMGDWNSPEGPAVGKLYAEHSEWGDMAYQG